MTRDKHLVPVEPVLFTDFVCPCCGSHDVEGRGTVWPGIHVMGDYRCRACDASFLRDLPVGFAVDHPMSIRKSDGRLFNERNGERWIHVPLMAGFNAPNPSPVGIERIVKKTHDRVIVLNTLDYLYGHVLLKLFNATHYLDAYSEHGLVVIVPRICQWLVPDGVAELWVVDQPLGQAHGWHRAIDAFVQAELPRYAEVLLGKGYAHPDLTRTDMARFTRVAPFALEQFMERPPHITFVSRTDRLWFASPLHKLAYRAFNRLGMRGFIRPWFVRQQTRRIARTFRSIRKALPNAMFSVVGIGRPGGLGTLAEDLRTTRMDQETETRWCRAYARSQVTIGVHGSNMLLPTAHAAGCVEILPYDRYGNIVQDISVRYADRMQLFLYRFVDEFAPPREVARHAAGMISDFTVFHRDNRENIF